MLKLVSAPLLMTWLEMLIKFGSGLLLLPIATLYLNTEELAFYLFIGTLLGLAYLAEGGLNKVILRSASYFNNGLDSIPSTIYGHSVTEKNATPNYSSFGKLYKTSFYLYLLLGMIAGFFLYFVGGIVADNLIRKQSDISEAKLSLLLISVFSFFYIVQLRYIAFLQGINYLAKQKRVEIVFGLLRLSLLFIAIISGFGVLGVTIGSLFSVFISLFLYKKMWNNLGPVDKITEYMQFDKSMLVQIFPASWRQVIIAWGSYSIYSGTTLLVAQLGDVKLIASYLLTLQIIFLLNTVSSAPAHSSYPEISKAIAEKDDVTYKSLLFRSLKISLSVYLLGSLVIIFLANPVLNFIGAKTEIISGSLLLFVLFMYLLELHHVIHATFYTATNHIPFVYPALISGAIILGVGYLVIDVYGIWGVVLLQFFVQLACNNWYPVYLNFKLLKNFQLKLSIFSFPR